MADKSRNNRAMNQPGQGSSFGANYASPMAYQGMQVPPFQPQYQDMYVQPYPISHFQGNALCQENTQFQGSGHFQGNAQYHANGQFPNENHFQNSPHFQANPPFEGSNRYQGGMQYQGNYLMPSNPGTRMVYDEYQRYIVNSAAQVPSMELQSGVRQFNTLPPNMRRGQAPKGNVRYNAGKMGQCWTYPPEQAVPPSDSQHVAASGSSAINNSRESDRNMCMTSDRLSTGTINVTTPANSMNFQEGAFMSSAKPVFLADILPPSAPSVNEAVRGESRTNPQGCESENFTSANTNEGGAKTRGMNRGRGGRGGRGGRRNYGPDRQSQGPNVPYNWSAYDQDQKKRDRDNALAATAAFMQNMSLNRTENPAPKEYNGNDDRGARGGRGGRGKFDRGGIHGADRRQQRSNFEEEKQGKDRKNRQVRTEDGKIYNGASVNTFDQTNAQERPNRQDKNFGRGRGGRRNNNIEVPLMVSEVAPGQVRNGEQEENAPFHPPGPRHTRGRGRGRNDNRTKLWGVSDQTSTKDNGTEKNDFKTDKETSPTLTPVTTSSGKEDEQTQRDRLTEQLTRGTYECMVCCDRIKQSHAIWSCLNCYNCFHLGCIKKWAKSSTGDMGWRCPACQTSTPKVPNTYLCFCGKLREPEWNRRETPHSCGEMCGRDRKIEWCTHKCNILCHPGPCPPCFAYIKRTCPCGAESRDVRCSITEPFVCEGVCNKQLNCKGHTCQVPCHTGPCQECQQQLQQKCHCGKESREVLCTEETFGISTFECGNTCERALTCGNHTCQEKCHLGDCKPCTRAVTAITMCPCGKVPLEKLYERDGAIQRKSCSDPIPTCSQPCQRTLKCGPPGYYHECQALCHEGPCPPCPLETPVRCRCGSMSQKVLCSQLTTKADEVICKKVCKKFRHCGRHKCNTPCCIDIDHMCMLICNKTLSCGLHKCEEPCHRGKCPRCWQTSFDELTCHCGASVMFPPVPCGTKPPPCEQPCSRPQNCSHKATHNCHPDEKCPPCTILVDKPCFGNHKVMKSTPCYVEALSCGAICDFDLPCGLHKCIRVCHEAPCVPPGKLCTQKCSKVRENCGHPCANPCHKGPCPDTSCKEMVKITCTCGNRKTMMQCSENDREYRALATSMLASQMQNMNDGSTVDLSDIFSCTTRPDKLKRLQCNEECAQLERNRRLALALQIENPEAREKLGNSSVLFSEFMKDEARRDPNLAKMVHDALTDLVLKAKESKQKSRSHSFAPMNREKRQFVHEYCEHFGCQSQAYDEEPKKNIVATAVKGMCYLPPMSVLALVQREQGQKKVPAPVFGKKTASQTTTDTQGMKKLEKTGSTEKEADGTAAKSQPIDYFDFED